MGLNSQNAIEREIRNENNIVFKYIGEYGWEVLLWSGIIRHVVKKYPQKNIVVYTRENRKDLYTNCLKDENIITFNIEGDYDTYSPRTNKLCLLKNKKVIQNNVNENSIITLKEEHKNYKQLSFKDVPCMHNPNNNFDLKTFDYNYQPHINNKKIIENILQDNTEGKIPITIFSRNRKSLTHRNWSNSPKIWHNLFKKISDTNKYLVFISGVSPAYVLPQDGLHNFFILENEKYKLDNTTDSGVMIESIKQSKFTFGLQSVGIALSNNLKVPNIWIGKEYNLINNYNVYKTKTQMISCDYSNDKEYIVDCQKVFNEIENFNNNIK